MRTSKRSETTAAPPDFDSSANRLLDRVAGQRMLAVIEERDLESTSLKRDIVFDRPPARKQRGKTLLTPGWPSAANSSERGSWSRSSPALTRSY
jgi:hypothetical protein